MTRGKPYPWDGMHDTGVDDERPDLGYQLARISNPGDFSCGRTDADSEHLGIRDMKARAVERVHTFPLVTPTSTL